MSVEFKRTKTHKWVGMQLCCILDKVTGEYERFGDHNSIGSFDDALDYVTKRTGWEERLVIVPMDCVVGVRL